MKLRLVLTGAFAALLVAFAGLSTQAVASGGATASSSSNLEKQANKASKQYKKANKSAKKAKKKAKKTCKKSKNVKKSKNASKSKKKKASKNCSKANKKASKAKKKANKAKKKSNKANKKLKNYNAQFFDVCKHGCKYSTVQNGVNAAGSWQYKNKGKKATVRIQPGTYVEGVLLHGKQADRNYDNLTIEGVKKNLDPNPDARQVILEGKNAQTVVKDTPGWMPGDAPTIPANNAIEGRSIIGLTMKNMWGRDYQNNTFFVWASHQALDNERCADFVMDNLVSSDTRSYGLFSRNCFGGKFLNSEGWNHGDSALYVGETPCDDPTWNNRGPNPGPCQANPDWTIVKNFKSHQNVLGYSGTNSKYVNISDSSFYNNGAGIVPNTLDSEKFEPNGWMVLENNDIFWNNYNYYSTGSEFKTVSNGLGEIAPGVNANYPTGIGILLFGSDGIISKNNRIFGNEKWGAGTISAPYAAGVVESNDNDDAKNMNNQFINNVTGRNGLDPNGTDFLNDDTGGGNCFQGNGPNPTYVAGNGSVPIDEIYPQTCPQPPVINQDVFSVNLSTGIQADPLLEGNDPNTVLGYAGVQPPADMECSWTIATPHPAFTDANGYTYTEKRADPVVCP